MWIHFEKWMVNWMVWMLMMERPLEAFQHGSTEGSGHRRRFRVKVESSTYTIDNIEVPGPLVPLTNYMLIKKDKGKGMTKGGLVLAKVEKAPTGTVVAVGPGKDHKETGTTLPVSATQGEKVLWGRYDGAEFKYCGDDHTLLRETDINLVWSGGDDPELETVRMPPGKLLLKVLKKPGTTSTGIIFDAYDDDIPLEGIVMKSGGGALTRDAKPLPLNVAEGDCVRFRDFDTIEINIAGQDFVIIDAIYCICKWKPLDNDDA